MKLIIKHVDGKTNVLADGKVTNGEFVGEYRYEGMTYGASFPYTETPSKDKSIKRYNQFHQNKQ